jgi:hypothetical protein
MDFDPRDASSSQHYLYYSEDFLNPVPDGSIIVWDAHFGPNEGRTPIERLLERKELRLLKVIKPEKPFKVLGGHDYKILVFQKDHAIVQKPGKIVLDFEESPDATEEKSYRGKKSFWLTQDYKYKTLAGFSYHQDLDTLLATAVQVSLAASFDQPFEPGEILLVCTQESADEVNFYEKQDLFDQRTVSGQWSKKEFIFYLPTAKTSHDSIKIYLWNKNAKELFIDDVFIQLSPYRE